MICNVIGWDNGSFKFNTSKPTGALSRGLDNSRAKELLGWEPEYSLEKGSRETIEWYSNYHSSSGNVSEKLLLEHK